MTGNTKRPFRFWSFFFSTKGRVSRVPYALWVPLTQGLILATSLTTPYLISHTDLMVRASILGLIGLCAFLFLWPHFTLTSKRLRDMSLSPFSATLLFVPFFAVFAYVGLGALSFSGKFISQQEVVHIGKFYRIFMFYLNILIFFAMCVLALIPGTKGANRYGPDPLNQDQAASDVF